MSLHKRLAKIESAIRIKQRRPMKIVFLLDGETEAEARQRRRIKSDDRVEFLSHEEFLRIADQLQHEI